MEKLSSIYLRVLDCLNEQFRKDMSKLSRQQQGIVVFLSEQQGAVNVKTIANKNFLTHQVTSGQLKQLLEKKIVEKHTYGRESFYELADVQFRHWLNLKGHRSERVIRIVDFIEQFYRFE